MSIELHPRMRDWHGWFWEVTGDIDTMREASEQSLAEAIDNDGQLAPVSAEELARIEKAGGVWISISGIGTIHKGRPQNVWGFRPPPPWQQIHSASLTDL